MIRQPSQKVRKFEASDKAIIYYRVNTIASNYHRGIEEGSKKGHDYRVRHQVMPGNPFKRSMTQQQHDNCPQQKTSRWKEKGRYREQT